MISEDKLIGNLYMTLVESAGKLSQSDVLTILAQIEYPMYRCHEIAIRAFKSCFLYADEVISQRLLEMERGFKMANHLTLDEVIDIKLETDDTWDTGKSIDC